MKKQTRIAFDGDHYVLAPEQDLVDLMERIEIAAKSEPTFVDFTAGNDLVSVLVCAGTRVVVTVQPERAPEDARYQPLNVGPLDWDY